MYDFAADSDKLLALAEDLKGFANEVEAKIANIYSNLDSIKENWYDES